VGLIKGGNFMRINIDTADYIGKTSVLVEISTISVDKNLPQKERCADFKRQIKDMHNYQSGIFTVKAVYANNGATIEDCLRGMMA
jgi:hypothetical protein